MIDVTYKPIFSKKVRLTYGGKKKIIKLTVNYILNAKKLQIMSDELTAAAENYDKTNNDADYQTLQNKTLELFGMIFGDKTAKTIFDFFDGKALEMSIAFLPFIRNVLTPAIEKAALNFVAE